MYRNCARLAKHPYSIVYMREYIVPSKICLKYELTTFPSIDNKINLYHTKGAKDLLCFLLCTFIKKSDTEKKSI